jgi:hypothetical protein
MRPEQCREAVDRQKVLVDRLRTESEAITRAVNGDDRSRAQITLGALVETPNCGGGATSVPLRQ